MTARPLVFIPTYNEAENVGPMCEQLLALKGELDILFMDDNSPDGTGAILEALAARHPRVRVIHRTGKLGIGTAHFEGIQWAYDHGYATLITMDCDFTHPPDKVLDLLDHGHDHDVVVGSRYMQRQSLRGWNPVRKLLTWTGHALTVTLLRMPFDATGAFRLYRLDRIPRHGFDVITSRGYSFFFESLYVLFVNGMRIREIPIALPPRTYGHSKMSPREVARSVRLLGTIYLLKLLNPEKFEFYEPLARAEGVAADNQGWDDYWRKQDFGRGVLYDTVAAFYRKVIIRPSLNHFVSRYFARGAKVLHAGCGSGQVDLDIRHNVRITGLDISMNALDFYRRTNKGHCDVLHGSVFAIPLPDAAVDGIYNLGVMEHFTAEEIAAVLKEFRRVLRSGGRLIVFWPPEFGLSVLFFKTLKWLLERVARRKDVKLHPEEVTRIRSRAHAIDLFEQSGFRVLEYSFGPKDLFTYSVIVAEHGGVPMATRASSSSDGDLMPEAIESCDRTDVA